VHIFYFYIKPRKIIGKILGHFFGKRGNKHALVTRGTHIYFRNKVVYLTLARSYRYERVKKSGRTYHLFYYLCGMVLFKIARCCGNKYRLIYVIVKFFKIKRTVIKGRGKPEPVFNKIFLSCAVAAVHTAYLRQRYVGFVHKKQIIVGKVIKQC